MCNRFIISSVEPALLLHVRKKQAAWVLEKSWSALQAQARQQTKASIQKSVFHRTK